jgi:hypothetical protein
MNILKVRSSIISPEITHRLSGWKRANCDDMAQSFIFISYHSFVHYCRTQHNYEILNKLCVTLSTTTIFIVTFFNLFKMSGGWKKILKRCFKNKKALGSFYSTLFMQNEWNLGNIIYKSQYWNSVVKNK